MDKYAVDQKAVMKIATDYFRKTAKDDSHVKQMLAGLARIIKDEGAKLVHIGNVLFLVLVRGEGVVEVHTIGEEKQPRNLAKNFHDLYKYLKNIGVKMAYTYAEDEKFKKLAKMVNLPIKEYRVDYQGKKLNVFAVEL